jgi:hypothetical protein
MAQLTLCALTFRVDFPLSSQIQGISCTLAMLSLLAQQKERTCHTARKLSLSERSNQPLAVVMTTFDLMKLFSGFATLAAASGSSALSR